MSTGTEGVPPPAGLAGVLQRRSVGRLLVDALLPRPWAPAQVRLATGADQGRALCRAAARHRVLPWLHSALSRDADGGRVSPALRAEVAGQVRADVLRVLALRAELPLLSAALHASAPWVVLKGPVLPQRVGATVSRSYGDLDLLVSRRDFPTVVEALEAVGCTVLERNWSLLRQLGPGELALRTPGGHHVDLHWHLLNDPEGRRAFPVSTEQLLERRTSTLLDGALVPVLDDVDMSLHVVLHAAKSGADHLIWLYDLAAAVERDPDWDQLVRTARAWQVQLPAAWMLSLTGRLLGLRVPRGVLSELDPHGVARGSMRAVQVVTPVQTATGPNLSRLLVRSLRADGRQTGDAVLRHARAWAEGRVRSRPAGPTAFDPDPQGDEEGGRRRFFTELLHPRAGGPLATLVD